MKKSGEPAKDKGETLLLGIKTTSFRNYAFFSPLRRLEVLIFKAGADGGIRTHGLRITSVVRTFSVSANKFLQVSGIQSGQGFQR